MVDLGSAMGSNALGAGLQQGGEDTCPLSLSWGVKLLWEAASTEDEAHAEGLPALLGSWAALWGRVRPRGGWGEAPARRHPWKLILPRITPHVMHDTYTPTESTAANWLRG